MRFTSQAEMDRNAKQWIVIILAGLVIGVTMLMVLAVAANDDAMVEFMKLFARQ